MAATKTAKPKKADVIEAPDPEVVQSEYLPTVTSAKELTIANKNDHALGLAMLQTIAVAEKRVKDLFKEPKAAAHAAHKAISAAEAKLLIPLADARTAVTQKCIVFANAEQKRAQAEAEALAELARKDETERKLQEAVEADERGDKAGAAAILEEEITVPSFRVEPVIARADGISTRTYYRCRVVSLIELVRYVAANPHEVALLQADETALRKRAESMKKGFKLPGCELDEQSSLAVKAL